MRLSDQEYAEVERLMNRSIHETVFALHHAEEDEIEAAAQCLMTARGNLECATEMIVAHEEEDLGQTDEVLEETNSMSKSEGKNPELNPFSYRGLGWDCTAQSPEVQVCGVEDRLRLVKEAKDQSWLQRVLAWPDTQKTVRQAAERRLRKLLKEQYYQGK